VSGTPPSRGPHRRSRVAVVGSRDYPDMEAVRSFVRRLALTTPDAVVVSGGARGVDAVAVASARRHGLEVEEIPADWSKGRAAGVMRNTVIVERADRVVAFWDGTSRGTLDTITKAKKAGKLVTVKVPGLPLRRVHMDPPREQHVSLYDDDIDPELVYRSRRRPRLICSCHSASLEPCAACQAAYDWSDEEEDTSTEEERARTRELLNWPVTETLYASEDELKAVRDAALSEGD
jgi:hypothetical protein